MSKPAVRKLLPWFFIGLLMVITVGPVLWVALSSLKTAREIISSPPTLWPATVTFEQYRLLLFETDFLIQLRNSLIVGLGTTALTTVVVVLAALGAYRGQMDWLRNLKFVAILAFVFPTTLLIVPIYEVVAGLNLIDTHLGLILVNVMLTAPFAFWLIEGFLDAVPREIEEAATVDGASRWAIYGRVILPLIGPGLGTISVYAFITSWTEFTFSSVLLIDRDLKTLPMGLADILAQYNIDWGLLTSNTVLAMIPGIIFFAFAGRLFIRGLVAGALKT